MIEPSGRDNSFWSEEYFDMSDVANDDGATPTGMSKSIDKQGYVE